MGGGLNREGAYFKFSLIGDGLNREGDLTDLLRMTELLGCTHDERVYFTPRGTLKNLYNHVARNGVFRSVVANSIDFT